MKVSPWKHAFLLSLLLLAVEARGQNLLLNGGFETNDLSASGSSGYLLGDSSINSTAPVASPWVFSANNGSGLTSQGNGSFALTGNAADGTAFAIVRKTSASTGTLSQSVNLVPGMYSLIYYEAGRGTTTYTSSTYTLRLAGTSPTPLTLTDSGGTGMTTETRTVAARSAFTEVAYTFTVTTADTYTLLFTGTAATPANASTYLDAVSITSVPEPSSVALTALLGTGGVVVVGSRRRRRS